MCRLLTLYSRKGRHLTPEQYEWIISGTGKRRNTHFWVGRELSLQKIFKNWFNVSACLWVLILTSLFSSSSLQRSLRFEWGATSGLTQVWSLLDKMVIGTLEYRVRLSSWAIWVICLCVRVPKKILGIFLLPSLSFPPSLVKAHGHWEQGSLDWKQKKKLWLLRFLAANIKHLSTSTGNI